MMFQRDSTTRSERDSIISEESDHMYHPVSAYGAVLDNDIRFQHDTNPIIIRNGCFRKYDQSDASARARRGRRGRRLERVANRATGRVHAVPDLAQILLAREVEIL